MTYTILHQNTGIASEMFFDSDEQRKQWLKNSEGWICLGPLEYKLPTRHVRMQNKEEFAGWGS